MPVEFSEFKKGKPPKGIGVQGRIMSYLEANSTMALSTLDIQDMFEEEGHKKSRQSINQALRALEKKGLIIRGFVEENSRTPSYVKLAPREPDQSTE